VFSGGSLAKVQGWADQVAASMGLTESQAVGLAASVGDLLKPMGFTADQAAAMSTQMLDLSGALSAWSGGTIDAAGVSDIMTKALLGERDGLKQLGISISEADVQARLAAKGQKGLTGAALEQAKAQATLELILEKSTDAQKAWADGSMDSIKAQNEAKASGAELQEQLTRALYPALQGLVPIITDVAGWVGDRLPGMMAKTQEFVQRELVPVFEQKLMPAFRAVVGWVQTNWPTISAIIEAVGRKIGTALQGLWSVIRSFVQLVQDLWKQFGDEIIAVVQWAWPIVEEVIGNAMQILKGIFDAFAALLRGDWSALWDAVLQILTGVWETIKVAVSSALQILGAIVSIAWSGIKNTTAAIWDEVKNLVGSAIDSAVSAVAGIPGRLAALGSMLWEAGKGVARAILDGLTAGVSGAWGFVADFASGLVAAVKGFINTQIIDRINNALEFSVSLGPLGSVSFNPPDIPHLERGGVITRPTMALLGETAAARPEIVTPERLMRSIIRDELAALGGGGARVLQPIQLTVNDRVLAETIIEWSNTHGGLPVQIRSGVG
jgi:hypothetical protein